MTRAEVVERFTIDRVQSSPARWNPAKLLDMNGIYIRAMSTEETAAAITPFLQRANLVPTPIDEMSQQRILALTPLIHERLKELGEAPELLDFFFVDIAPPSAELLIPKKMDATATKAALEAIYATLSDIVDWHNAEGLETSLRALCEKLDLKPGQLFGAIRVAVSARTVAPPLFEMLIAFGKETTLKRIAAAISVL
jgi:glutamyl-tRNA synthetase